MNFEEEQMNLVKTPTKEQEHKMELGNIKKNHSEMNTLTKIKKYVTRNQQWS